MAQDAQGGRSGSGRGNRKRRYFRRKPGDAQTEGDAPSSAPAKAERTARSAPPARDAQSSRDSGGDRTSRTSSSRRRRKSKGRRGGAGGREQAALQAQEINYVPPTSVYIYTHIVRPAGASSYEFRSEHFSKVGRALEDYDVDVSPLFDEAARAAARPNMAEVFADFDLGEEFDPPAPAEPLETFEQMEPVEHMDANLLATGGETGLPTYAEDPYGAEDTAPADEAEPDGTDDISVE